MLHSCGHRSVVRFVLLAGAIFPSRAYSSSSEPPTGPPSGSVSRRHTPPEEERLFQSCAQYVVTMCWPVHQDPLTTAAAIDRVVVHHSLIVEFGRDIKSYRAEEAARRTGIHFDGPTTAQDTAA